MKTLALGLALLCAPFLRSQTLGYLPTPVLLTTLVGGVPTPATGSGTSLSYMPKAVLCYGLNVSGQAAPCVFSAGGGSSVGTAGQLQMVGSTTGSFAASALTDNSASLMTLAPAYQFRAGAAGNLALTTTGSAGFNALMFNSTTTGLTPNVGLITGLYSNPSTPILFFDVSDLGTNGGSYVFNLDGNQFTTLNKGGVSSPAFTSIGTAFSVAGCGTATAITGGPSAGNFTGGSATCTPVITMGGVTAPHGWSCHINDRTTATAAFRLTSSTTTTATFTAGGTVGATDIIDFGCDGF